MEIRTPSMERLRRTYLVEQTATHLRERLRATAKGEKLPGVINLATQLGVSKTTVRAAFRMLESEGIVSLGDDGLSRYVTGHAKGEGRPFRIGILTFDELESESPGGQRLLLGLQVELEKAGFASFFSAISQCGLRHHVGKISRYVRKTEADAWVIVSGSFELLGWFAGQNIPCMAFAGRRRTYSMAAVAPDTVTPFLTMTRKLIELGHRRIVFLTRKPMRLPEPGFAVKAFIEEMNSHGIPVNDYNLPDWEETREGMKALLHALFQITPPTVIIVLDAQFVTAVLQFLGSRKIVIPEQISLVAADDDPSFEWCDPPISHIRWSNIPAVRRIVRWANAISRGRKDLKQHLYPAEIVVGGTIGPVPKP